VHPRKRLGGRLQGAASWCAAEALSDASLLLLPTTRLGALWADTGALLVKRVSTLREIRPPVSRRCLLCIAAHLEAVMSRLCTAGTEECRFGWKGSMAIWHPAGGLECPDFDALLALLPAQNCRKEKGFSDSHNTTRAIKHAVQHEHAGGRKTGCGGQRCERRP